MPRYLVERDFPGPLPVTSDDAGRQVCATVMANNATQGVNWVQSFVADSGDKTFCIYDGPDANAIREAASLSGLPVTSVTPISVLDPHFFLNTSASG